MSLFVLRNKYTVAKLAVLQVCFFIITALPETTFAFKQKYHEQITEEKLKAEGFDDDSADQVGDANWWTDIFESSSDAAHADNNQLDAASDRLISKRTTIGDALSSCERRTALNNLGQALHTTQDIFSHSNSIDNSIPVLDLLSLSRGSAACSLPNFAPGGLVTGYFSLSGYFTGNQCRGLPSNECCHRDLNKDAPGEANGSNHGAAISSAKDATGEYLSLVEDDIRARFGEPSATKLIKMMKKKQRTAYFVIDDTGSMGDDLDGVKISANSILDEIIANDEAPTLGLVSFKDSPDDRGVSCDIENLRSEINSLFASGGGDCPEASNSAMLSALSHFPLIVWDMQRRGGQLILATDASAGDAYLGPQVAIEAALKGVNINAILTGDCAAETGASAAKVSKDVFFSNNDQNAAKNRVTSTSSTKIVSAVNDPLTSPSARTQLRALTQITGGVLFNVERIEVGEVVPTLLELSKPDTAIVFSRTTTLATNTPTVFDIPIDDTLNSEITFMITAMQADPLPVLTLHRPDGSLVNDTDVGVTRRTLSSVDSISLKSPPIGHWQLKLEGTGSFALRVFGATPFRLNSVTLLTSEDTPPRPEIDFIPLSGQPVSGSSLVADLRLTNAPSSILASTLRPDGASIQDLNPLESIDGVRRFRANLTVPNDIFIVEVKGKTNNGADFVRDVNVPAQPQTVAVEASPSSSSVRPGSVGTINVRIRNVSSADATYQLQANSSLNWIIDIPTTVNVIAGGTAEVSVSVHVPLNAIEGTLSTVSILAEDSISPRVRNNASVSVIAGAINAPPDCTAAFAKPATLFPSDHKMHKIAINGVTDPNGDAINLIISKITQDEPVCGRKIKKGVREPDGLGVGTGIASVRSSHSEKGNGRVYQITFSASDGHGESCTGAVNVGVPRHRGQIAIDSGQKFDSTIISNDKHGKCEDDDSDDKDK